MRPGSCRLVWPAAKWSVAALFLAVSCIAQAQILYQDQEVQVHDLPSLTATTHDPSDVLLASADTIMHDKELCCGKDSALTDSVAAADPKSLKDIAGKLDGRHLLGDGRPIQIKAEYLTPDQIYAGRLLTKILDQHAALMMWNSHLYVVYGVVFIWQTDSQGGVYALIHKLLLWDTRYSDARRKLVFTRGEDEMGKIEGLLFVGVEH